MSNFKKSKANVIPKIAKFATITYNEQQNVKIIHNSAQQKGPQGPLKMDELLPISMNLPDPNHWFFVATKSPCKTAECVINSQPPLEEEAMKQKKIEACMKAAKNRKNVKVCNFDMKIQCDDV